MRILLTVLMCLLSQNVMAKTTCFIAIENGKIIEKLGNCEERFPPCSTFKLPLAAMGFDSKILTDENNPVWKYKPGYADFLEIWKQDHTPQKWLKNSCIWYSRQITHKMGIENFRKYITDFKYGNMDASHEDALDNSWLSNSLQISPMEQISFLEKLLNGRLPISKEAHTKTINSIDKSLMINKDWSFHGKSGSGSKNGESVGWYIGWVQKNDRKIIFTHLMQGDDVNGLVAKELTRLKFIKYLSNIKNLEKNK